MITIRFDNTDTGKSISVVPDFNEASREIAYWLRNLCYHEPASMSTAITVCTVGGDELGTAIIGPGQ